MIFRILLALAALAYGPLPAQIALPERVGEQYAIHVEPALTAEAYAITVQPVSASTGQNVVVLMVGATAYCPEDCTFTAEVDGDAATQTGATPVAVAGNRRASRVAAFTASDSTGGTVVESISIPATQQRFIDLTGVTLPSGAVSSRNVTIRISSVTGTARLTFVWREYP